MSIKQHLRQMKEIPYSSLIQDYDKNDVLNCVDDPYVDYYYDNRSKEFIFYYNNKLKDLDSVGNVY